MLTRSQEHIQPAAPNEALDHAIALLDQGRIVAIPTETVYGLAADATNGEAVAKIFAAKGRPQFNPLISHVSSREMALSIANFSEMAHKLADAFWPGPLTLVLPLGENSAIHPLVTSGLETVGVRHPLGLASKIIARLGRPLAAPSANMSGKISPTSALAVQRSLGDNVDLIVDDGPCEVGLESTIVKVDGEHITLLRPGSVTIDKLESVCGVRVHLPASDGIIQAPGMLATHYAPDSHVRLNSNHVSSNEALLAFGPTRIKGSEKALKALNLSEDGSLIEAAANLFAMLNELDHAGPKCIAVEPIPVSGIGLAINDRLTRAAAPRGPADG